MLDQQTETIEWVNRHVCLIELPIEWLPTPFAFSANQLHWIFVLKNILPVPTNWILPIKCISQCNGIEPWILHEIITLWNEKLIHQFVGLCFSLHLQKLIGNVIERNRNKTNYACLWLHDGKSYTAGPNPHVESNEDVGRLQSQLNYIIVIIVQHNHSSKWRQNIGEHYYRRADCSYEKSKVNPRNESNSLFRRCQQLHSDDLGALNLKNTQTLSISCETYAVKKVFILWKVFTKKFIPRL